MTIYKAEQARKVLKAEQAEYIQEAIELARTANPSYEASLDPTGSTLFYHLTTHAALEHYADLKAQGWTLQHLIPACNDKLYSFVAVKPESVFELDIPQIALRAENAYLREIEAHNKVARKEAERVAYIESEFQRREQQRQAQLRAELASEYDSRGKTQFVSENQTRLHG